MGVLGKAWRSIEGFHTANWLWPQLIESSVIASAVGWLAARVDHTPISVAVLFGLVGFAVFLFILELLRHARRDNKPPQLQTANEGSAPQLQPLTQAERSDAHIRNRDVFLRDLIVDQFRVRGRTFEDCVIHGPAVISFLRCVLDNSPFEGKSLASVFVPIWPNRYLRGTILVKDCVFRRCVFRNISMIGALDPPDELEQNV